MKIQHHFTLTAEKAHMSGTKAAIASIAFGLAAVLTVKLGYFVASLPLIAVAGACFRHTVTAARDMRHFYDGARFHTCRTEARKNPSRIYTR